MVLTAAFILLLPLAVMQFTDEVDWNLVDFAIAGVLLIGAGFVYEILAKKLKTTVYRVEQIIKYWNYLWIWEQMTSS